MRYGAALRLFSRQSAPLLRTYSSHVRQKSWYNQETIEIPVGGSGSVELCIKKPLTLDPRIQPSVLIDLPPGLPRALSTARTPILASIQELLPQAVVVTIHYRLSQPPLSSDTSYLEHRFPRPIHDVTVCFEKLVSNILPEMFPEHDEIPNIHITGSHIGGALATSLALTEPESISGVSILDPIVDWVMFDEHASGDEPSSSRARKASTADPAAIKRAARAFLSLRHRLFTTPSAYFDPFASPLLFLRAPGRDTPRTHAEAMGLIGQLQQLTLSDTATGDATQGQPGPDSREDYGPYDDDNHTATLKSPTNVADADSPSDAATQQVRRYKVLRRWPPTSRTEDVLLPRFRIHTTLPTDARDGYNWLLNRQSTELATYLRRACFWGREKSLGEERVVLSELPAGTHSSDATDSMVKAMQLMMQADESESDRLQDYNTM